MLVKNVDKKSFQNMGQTQFSSFYLVKELVSASAINLLRRVIHLLFSFQQLAISMSMAIMMAMMAIIASCGD